MKTLALFNNKGGVGKTTLAYHLAHMFPHLGRRTLAVDLDPQSNFTSQFLEEDTLENQLWIDAGPNILTSLAPILSGKGDIAAPEPIKYSSPAGNEALSLLCGHLGLSRFEDKLSESWPKCLAKDEAALRVTTAFHRLIQLAGAEVGADIAIIDVGPNLGAINRAALLAADFLLVPLGADLFSLQGLKNLGPTVREWRDQWQLVLSLVKQSMPFSLPQAKMEPCGYVVVRHAVRLDRPALHSAKWMDRIPPMYAESVLGVPPSGAAQDGHCLAKLRNYGSLMPMSHEARKPMFDLRPADGAIGSHAQLVQTCREDFEALAKLVLKVCGV